MFQIHIVKKSFCLSGHQTSVKLEEDYWCILEEIANDRKITLKELVEYEDCHRKSKNLASHLRILVLHTLKQRLEKAYEPR